MKSAPAAAPTHGAPALTAVVVETYNAELRDSEGFIGDRASNRAFRAILDDLRDRLRAVGQDPLGETPTDELSKRKLEKLLGEGDPEAAGVVHGAIEEFSSEFAGVVRQTARGDIYTAAIGPGGQVVMERVGSARIVFRSPGGADLEYTAFGKTATVAITRQPF